MARGLPIDPIVSGSNPPSSELMGNVRCKIDMHLVLDMTKMI